MKRTATIAGVLVDQFTVDRDRGAYLRAASEALGELIPAASVGWLDEDKSRGVVEIQGTGASTRPEIAETVRRTLAVHPLAVSFRSRPEELTPRRLSDVISMHDLRRHVVYEQIFQPMGDRYQLGVAVRSRPGALNAWVFNRSGPDFTDAEIELAGQLLPLLQTFDRVVQLAPEPLVADADRRGLSTREVEVLRQLAVGLTAGQIAVALGISMRTVHKHLENAYVKLGCHDRLGAVAAGIRLGLLPEQRALRCSREPAQTPADARSDQR